MPTKKRYLGSKEALFFVELRTFYLERCDKSHMNISISCFAKHNDAICPVGGPFCIAFACMCTVSSQQSRNELLRSSSWLTYGEGHSPARAPDQAAADDLDHFVYPHVLRQLNDGHVRNVVVRQGDGAVPAPPPPERVTVITGSGGKSTFNASVVNVPAGLDVTAAITRAIAIMENAWSSSVTVQMRVAFTKLGGKDVLANGGGTFFVEMAQMFDSVLPIAAAEAARGENMNRAEGPLGRFDVLITVNENTNWYTGIDGKPGNEQYDLITVLLHEVYHNLIFAGGLTVDVRRDKSLPGGIRQTARFQQGVTTRFDSFLANKQNCQVLGYLQEEGLARNISKTKTTAELLADALTNDELYFAYQAFGPIAQLYAPRVFRPRSSIYHFDPKNIRGDDRLMAPTIRRGSAISGIGPVILNMQRVFLDSKIKGANPGCPRPLLDPTPAKLPVPNDRSISDMHPGAKRTDGVRRIAGLRVWAFAVIVAISGLVALILLGLCIFCIMSYLKARRAQESTVPSDGEGASIAADEVPCVSDEEGSVEPSASVVSGESASDKDGAAAAESVGENGSYLGSATGTSTGVAPALAPRLALWPVLAHWPVPVQYMRLHLERSLHQRRRPAKNLSLRRAILIRSHPKSHRRSHPTRATAPKDQNRVVMEVLIAVAAAIP